MRSSSFRNDTDNLQAVIDGYVNLVRQRVDAGWPAYLATMLFRPLPGNPSVVLAQMLDEAQRVYSTFLTRAVRRPLSSGRVGDLPILIVAPDAPVGKTGKPVEQVVVNNGVHLHGVLVVPPASRLGVPADEHFRAAQALYVRDRSRLDRLHVVPIEGDVGPAVAYALKSLARRRWPLDELLVLPRSVREVRGPRMDPEAA